MKTDIPRLMADAHLDAAVISGASHGNPHMYYMVNGAHIGMGFVVQRRGEEPVLIHASMERDEAARSGLQLINVDRYEFLNLLRQEGDRLKANVRLFGRIFDDLGVHGRVGFYGTGDQGAAYVLLSALQAGLPDIQVVGEFDGSIYQQARVTKDVSEVERLRRVARETVEAVDHTVEFLRHHRVRDEVLVRDDGQALTIGEVKREIRRALFERNLVDSDGLIFAIGRDAGVPHTSGEDGDTLALGKTIVFDIFPQENGGGYFTDMTRTFCLGYTTPEVQKTYDQVMECFGQVSDSFQVGVRCAEYQALACRIFESQGHPTIAQDSKTQQGYVHMLSHGVGLNLHERPYFSNVPSNTDTLQPGMVFTVEPGLYYPEQGFGVRVEDTVYVNEHGQIETLTEYPRELVIEL